MNQLKVLEVQLSKGITELDGARKAAEKANFAVNEIDQKKIDALAGLEQVKQTSTASTALLEQIKDAGTQASSLYSTIQQQEKLGGELTFNIKTAHSELLSLDASIKKFYEEIEQNRQKINKVSEDAADVIRTSTVACGTLVEETTAKVDSAIDSLHKLEASVTEELTKNVDAHLSETKVGLATFQKECEDKLQAALVETASGSAKLVSDSETKIQTLEQQLDERSSQTIELNRQKTEILIEELQKLESRIREQIQQATGFTLFGAFQARQNQIAGSKKIWATAIFALVIISAAVTAWIAYEAKDYKVSDVALWVKLSLTVPLGFAIGFCTVQYSRERRLEEEYAFKSSISVSLNPYRDLIHSMLEKDGAIDQTKYTQFVIDSVTNVFTPPTDKVFESEKKPGLTAKTLKQAAEIAGTFTKAAK